jgi:hypothetical protein
MATKPTSQFNIYLPDTSVDYDTSTPAGVAICIIIGRRFFLTGTGFDFRQVVALIGAILFVIPITGEIVSGKCFKVEELTSTAPATTHGVSAHIDVNKSGQSQANGMRR